jgi:hypothetical protein
MYIKITLNALTQFSINEHVYNSKIAYIADRIQKALPQLF